jgi:ABC-type multidrug transport system fused ATPase/permease subunit
MTLTEKVNDSSASPSDARPQDRARPIFRVAALVLAFALGCLATWLFRFFFSGTPVNLSAEAFVSLVFTVAVGAASLVLAILAINFGRLSERVITDRADKSIDIQMRLFEKSLALQTQLFDKNMSTLEAIGRSTGPRVEEAGCRQSSGRA